MILENLKLIESNMERACKKSERDIKTVCLIAVSKTKPIEMIAEVYDAGYRDFGENRVQELVEKYDCMPKDIRWHLIGHLQRNKVKYVIDKVYMIHSVDSFRLAEEISKEAVKKQIIMKILVEVNVACEESKYGVTKEETIALIEKMALLPGIRIEGLMTIAPNVKNPEDNRQYFAELQQLVVDIIRKNIDNTYMNVLSMGMTNDYQVAIEEGANLIRVGTGIFGYKE